MNVSTEGKKKIPMQIFIWMVFSFLVLPQVFVFPVSANSSTYYVSTTGSDSSSGTIDHPWRTIQKAVNTVVAGDTVYVRTGSYDETVTFSGVTGTSDAWITFMPYNGEHVIIHRPGMPVWNHLIIFRDGAKYIRISGFEIKDTADNGIFLYGGEITDIRIDNCTIHDCEGPGIYCYSSDYPTKYVRNVTFDYNTVYDVNNGLSYEISDSPQEAISFSNVQGFEIHHNNLSSYGKEGIDCKSGSSNGSVHHNTINVSSPSPVFSWGDWNHLGIYIDGYSLNCHDIDIYNNYISGSGGRGIVLNAEQLGSITNINVYNNIIYITYNPSAEDHMRGITIGDGLVQIYATNIHIYSNTVYTDADSMPPMTIFLDKTHLINAVIKNNIFASLGYYSMVAYTIAYADYPSCMILSNNLFSAQYGSRSEWNSVEKTVFGVNSVLLGTGVNEGFVNIANSNFHLNSTSSAIDMGNTTNKSSMDYEGITRPQGAGYDIGAYEYAVSGSLEITGITIDTSHILDTDASFGWQNITCTVTSNFAVSHVFLIIARPNGTIFNTSMSNTASSDLYYYNTSFPLYGNYTYSIWACDTGGDGQASGSYAFSMPPNWDINNDGRCTILDQVLISVQYERTGPQGWIREDTDNNGVINMLDLIITSNHYGESWWL